MTRFRPCIDLHRGQVKQIVGGTLRDDGNRAHENFVSEKPAAEFAALYARDSLVGGHVIKLGAGNDEPARAALLEFPQGLQIGGGINLENAITWLEAGASHVIVTSWLFEQDGTFLPARLDQLVTEVGRERIVIDLSCRRTAQGWTVAMNRWQTLTELTIDGSTLDRLAQHADEFLIHAADVEGLCGGIDRDLVMLLGDWGQLPITYAGGVASFEDVPLINELSQGRVDVTVGSALDIFGGTGVRYQDLVAWNQRDQASPTKLPQPSGKKRLSN